MTKYYKAELDDKIIIRSSTSREFPYAVIFGKHWITSGYASFCGSLEAAQKAHKDFSKRWSDTHFIIVSTVEISQDEFKTIKTDLDAIKKQLVEAK
jgi:hypothetical protein